MKDMTRLSYWLGLSTIAISACSWALPNPPFETPRADRISPTEGQVSAAEAYLRRLPQLVPEEELQVERTESVRISSSAGHVTAMPFVATMHQGNHARLTRCLILLQGPTQTDRVVERTDTGFSDDYEPCKTIRLKSIVDVNSDGTVDLVYEVQLTDAMGSSYALLDVYLISQSQRVCFSPKASVHLSSKYSNNRTKLESGLAIAQLQTDPVLRHLTCD